MNSISLKAYAKINLGLDVLGTLPDGYHEVKMVMQSISLYDKVNIKKNDSGTINVKTNLSYLPVNGDNLVYKAAYIMKEKYNIQDGFDIDLFKFIPVAAGMAGGSTDAAAVPCNACARSTCLFAIRIVGLCFIAMSIHV